MSSPLQTSRPPACRQPRIVILTADLPPDPWSGIGLVVAQQAQSMAQLGCSVTVFFSGTEARRLPCLKGVDVRRLPRDCFPDAGKFDCIHLHSLSLAPLALELARRSQKPLVYMAHTRIMSEVASGANYWEELQVCVLLQAAHVIFLNRQERNGALSAFPSLKHRSSVVAHGISVPAAMISHLHRPRRIVFAGRFCESKGVDLAIMCIAEVLRLMPDSSALIAGSRGETAYQARLAALAGEFHGRVRITGWLPHKTLQDEISRSALLVMPSRYEPFGLTALEALRLGTPVLAANTGGLREHLASISGCRTISSQDPTVWACEALTLLENADLRNSLGRASQDDIASRFHAERQTRELLTVTGYAGDLPHVA